MKRTFALLLALLVSLLTLSYAESDDIARLEAEIEALRTEVEALKQALHAHTDPTVIARFDGGCIYFEDVYSEYESIRDMFDLYFQQPFDWDASQEIELQKQITCELAERAVIDAYLNKSGVTLLTDEQTAEIEERAKWTHDALSADYDEEALKDMGCDVEALIKEYTEEALSLARIKHLAGEVNVSEEYLKEFYEEYARNDEEYYSENPDELNFELAYGGALITCYPEGFRKTNMLVVPFTGEQLDKRDEIVFALEAAETDDEIQRLNAELDDVYAALKLSADEVYEIIKAGEKLTEMPDEYPLYGPNEGMIVSEGCAHIEPNVVSAAMALDGIGSISEPVRSNAGYVIIEYISDITPGRVPFDDVKAELFDIAYETLEHEQYTKNAAALVEAANIEYFFAGLN